MRLQPPDSFDVLVAGRWALGEVRTCLSANSRRIVPEVERLIEQKWQAAIAAGIRLFDGPMCRLESWSASGSELNLVLSQTSYKPFFGTNLTNAAIADRFGAEVLANPVGVSSALITADGFLALGRRNATVAYYPNRVHPFAGALEPADAGDVFQAVRRELEEELAIEPSEILESFCSAIVQDRSLRQPELIFPTYLSLSTAEVEGRLDAVEHGGCYMVPFNSAGLEQAVKDPALTPVAAAALIQMQQLRA